MNIAIIPARGGSKRIPRKNIKEFCGKPMICYSIDAAKESGVFDKIIVSTDDDEIANIAKDCGAEVPFMRPKYLSDDNTATTPVIIHAIKQMENLVGSIDNVCCIYATAPFIQSNDLRKGLDLLIEKKCNFVFTVTSFPYPIQRALKIVEGDKVEMFDPDCFDKRSQDLEEAYHDAGQFYWGKSKAFVDNIMTFSRESSPFILPRYRVQDIDVIEDWIEAEIKFELMKDKVIL
jgi:N-acylneuraminate cytidylyltransferase